MDPGRRVDRRYGFVGIGAGLRVRAARWQRRPSHGPHAGGAEYPASYIDSGTETDILADEGLPRCAGMSWAYCVSPTRSLAATMVGADGASVDVPFNVGDYRGALDRHVGAWDAFAEAAQPSTRAFVWGAPFFIGRRVALVFDGATIGTQGQRDPLLYAIS